MALCQIEAEARKVRPPRLPSTEPGRLPFLRVYVTRMPAVDPRVHAHAHSKLAGMQLTETQTVVTFTMCCTIEKAIVYST